MCLKRCRRHHGGTVDAVHAHFEGEMEVHRISHLCGSYASQLYVSLTQARVIVEKETSVKKMFSLRWPVGKPMVHFLDCCGWVQLTVGGATLA